MSLFKSLNIPSTKNQKRNLRTFLLFTLFSVLLSPVFAQEVKVEVDTMNIRIGEQFNYQLSVNDTSNVIIPKLQNLKGLEVLEDIDLDTVGNNLFKKYVLTGFDSGAYYIPAQQVFIRNRAYLTDSILINVATVAIDTTKQKMFPIKSIESEPYTLDDFLPYLIWVILGVLALSGIILFFILREKRRNIASNEGISALPPFEEAIERLQKLDEKLLWQNNQVKQYYSELTEIIRVYIEKELKIPALESTTDDLIETLRDFSEVKTIEASRESIRKLKELLREADLVKFAKSQPLSHEIEEDRKDAEFVLKEMKPRPIEEIAEEKAMCLITGKDIDNTVTIYRWSISILGFSLRKVDIPVSSLGKEMHKKKQSVFWQVLNPVGNVFMYIPWAGGYLLIIWLGIIGIPVGLITALIDVISKRTPLDRGMLILTRSGKVILKSNEQDD